MRTSKSRRAEWFFYIAEAMACVRYGLQAAGPTKLITRAQSAVYEDEIGYSLIYLDVL